MSILSAEALSLSFGARDVFTNINLEVQKGAKIGLVGPNGIGKTSLLRILAGISPPDAGSVRLLPGTWLGYLRQEAIDAFAGHEHTVYEEMLTVFAETRSHGDRLRDMEVRMAAGETTEELLIAYGAAQDGFERGGGYDYDTRIARVLEGLGLRDQRGTAIHHLSGGQQTRALLARLLLEEPTILILDEPTNHLDVHAVEWLEKTLHGWDGALIVASHDRYFLDSVVDRIWELSPTHLETYRGNYSAYARQRQERWERNQDVYDRERERLEKELEMVRRYFAWRKFDEAHGKLKLLGRDLLAIDRFGIVGAQGKSWSEIGIRSAREMSLEEAHRRITELRPPAGRPPRPHLRLRAEGRSGQMVLRTDDLRIGYEDKALCESGDLWVDRLDRVALIGPNGSGKTTFLRTILGDLSPVSGEVTLGHGLKIGYFAQAHDGLEPRNSVFDELLRHKNLSPGEARNYLAQYLFTGDDVWKAVGALSGGERARLALAILTLQGVNVLLLDEPTNHLDIAAQEVLQEGLERFDGTLLLVSHDRYLVDALATQIWELRDGRLEVFKGTYREYLDAQERDARQTAEIVSEAAKIAVRPRSGRSEKEQRKRERLLTSLEDRIAATEASLAEYIRQLQDDGAVSDFQRAVELSESYAEAQSDLECLMAEWTALAGQEV